MKSSLNIVGLSMGHDGGCALFSDGVLRYAVSEERLNRTRYSPGWTASLLYCLAAADLSMDSIDLFVFSTGGSNLTEQFHGGLRHLGIDPARIAFADHHLSHAYSSFCLSGFSDALVMVMDAVGNNQDTESFYWATGSAIEKFGGNSPDRARSKGIGSTYEAFTNFLGFTDQESGKVMALAAYGNPEAISFPLFDVEGTAIASRLKRTHQWGVIDFGNDHGLGIGPPFPSATSQRAWDIAAYIQHQLEVSVLQVVSSMLAETGSTRLCLSGGVALNCVMNTAIRNAFSGLEVYIPPAPSDVGQPLGNALYGHWLLTGEVPLSIDSGGCFGRSYERCDVEAALRRDSLTIPYGRLQRHLYHYWEDADPASAAAQLISDGHLVGWFQGRSEFGPRALGRRSILADVRRSDTKELINERIKHREWFRPFAPSMLREHCSDYFGLDRDWPYMVEAPEVLPDKRHDLRAAVHVDGSARVQTVTADSDSLFHRLLAELHRLTGVPAVLNTSFNDREPMIETPGDALFTFLSGSLDYLVIGNFIVAKGPG